MNTTEVLVKFDSLDDAAKEVVIKIIDLLASGTDKSKKNGKKGKAVEEALDFRKFDKKTRETVTSAIARYKKGDFTGFLTQEQIEEKYGVSFENE